MILHSFRDVLFPNSEMLEPNSPAISQTYCTWRKSCQKIGDPFRRAANKKLTFGEGLNTFLGYSQKGTRGSGIGPEMAERILTTIHIVVKAGISDPKLFDLVPVIEENIGADRISDMVSIILKDEFGAYTTRIAPCNRRSETRLPAHLLWITWFWGNHLLPAY